MSDQAGFLLFLHPVPHIEIIEIFRSGLAQVVQQIKIKISRSRLLQGCVELRVCFLLRLAVNPCGVFGGQLEALPGITLHQRLPDGVLGARIGPGRIKIGKSCFHEQVHHLFCLFHVNRVALLRQPHQAKAQFLNVFTQITHHTSSLLTIQS